VVNPSTEAGDVANRTDKGLIRDLLSRIWRDESISDLDSTLNAIDAVNEAHGWVFEPGAPIGWKAELGPQAIEVVAGSFTTVSVPLTPSYIIAGRVTDLANKPVAGAKVEMLPINSKKLGRSSLTNRAGIYYLEDLQQGKYRFKINDRAVKKTLTLDQNSEPLVEMDFQIEVK